MCCRFYWCEFRNRDGKQICWHLWCWIKSSVLPVPINGFSWESGKRRITNGCYLFFLFFFFLFHCVCWSDFIKLPTERLLLECAVSGNERDGERERSFTFLLSVCKRKRVSSVNDGDVEHGFHVRFIKTREHWPGHGWFNMSSSKESKRRKTTTNKQSSTKKPPKVI